MDDTPREIEPIGSAHVGLNAENDTAFALLDALDPTAKGAAPGERPPLGDLIKVPGSTPSAGAPAKAAPKKFPQSVAPGGLIDPNYWPSP